MLRHMALSATLPLAAAPLSTLPKRPKANPYTFFVKEQFPAAKTKHPQNTPSKIILKTLSESWQKLSTHQKTVYTRKATERVQEHDNFFKSAPLTLLYELEDKKEKRLAMKKFEELGRLPRKPPLSGYHLYVSRQKRIPDCSPQQNIKKFAATFQLLSEGEKERLREEVIQMKREYEVKMAKLMNV